ncbi:HypC/HybG/HupF family hydrogenase formation chaperone [Sciscionella marina]|uniref:HypC/HybG/HupF family hydrogenase formation chaperone n=1 Tax=Sciscionella marina TaxID=508770 RepID=UPI000372AE84|nr:HypC/HybG/HupF family hydrogenase formation chaperone [Sciscionella marina]
MCLGIPGCVVELAPDNDQLAVVEVAGARRTVNIGLLEPAAIGPGDWIVIHMGFAMERVEPEQAAAALAGLETIGRPDAELPGRPVREGNG